MTDGIQHMGGMDMVVEVEDQVELDGFERMGASVNERFLEKSPAPDPAFFPSFINGSHQRLPPSL